MRRRSDMRPSPDPRRLKATAATLAPIPADLGEIMPAQWQHRHPPRTSSSRLAAAVLREAAVTLRKAPTTSRVYLEAYRYFFGAPDPTVAMPLEFACALVGLEPQYVRRVVRLLLVRHWHPVQAVRASPAPTPVPALPAATHASPGGDTATRKGEA